MKITVIKKTQRQGQDDVAAAPGLDEPPVAKN